MLIEILTEGLPEKQKLIFSLRDLQGLSVEETAEISGMTESKIKSNLYHARKHLREQLTNRMNFQMKM
jgi:RNA polymerase sigma-70 factor (ECF subfamily)